MPIDVTIMTLDWDSEEGTKSITCDKNDATVGRLENNDIVLNRAEVSGEHARLRVDERESGEVDIYITDLGSSNGTMVGNKAIEPFQEVELTPNEPVIIGSYLLKVAPAKGTGATSSDNGQPSEEKEKSEDSGVEETASAQETVSTESKGDDESEERASTSSFSVASVLQGAEGKEAVYSATVETDNILNLDLEALRVCSISGEVKHGDSPLAGVEIDAGSLGTTTTDDAGRFSFSEVEEDTPYKITAKKDGYRFEGAEEGTVADDVVVALCATRLVRVSGKITHKGSPLAGVELDAGPLGKTLSGEDGSYTFENVPEHTPFTIRAVKDGYKLVFKGNSGS